MKERLFLIDATAFCYRAYFAVSSLTTSSGFPTGAIYGFVNMLNKLLKDEKPRYLAACFDISRETFRQKKFAEYKANRVSMPDDLGVQMPYIKQIISAYGIAILEKEGFEADDIIATLAQKAKDKKISVTIISSDKDILQLVDKSVTVLSPYKDEGVLYDTVKVQERFQVKPHQIADIIALMGDSVDNIPSIPGIGEKTAVELITEFGSVEKLIKNYRKVDKDRLRASIGENIEKIKLNKELAVLTANIDMDLSLDELKVKDADNAELTKIFRSLEFRKFLKEIPQEEPAKSSLAEAGKLDDKALERISKEKEVCVYSDNADKVFIHIGTRSFECSISEASGIMTDPKIKKTGHDLKKMKVALGKLGLTLEGLDFDTMIAAYLLNPARPSFSLEDLGIDFLDKSHFGSRAEECLDTISKLKPRLESELIEKSLRDLFVKIEMPLAEVLAEMELTGITIDVKLLAGLSAELDRRLEKLIKDIYKLSGEEFNINSPKQLGVILFERLKLPVIKKTKTGFSTDEEVLKRLASKHDLPALLLDYRQLMKLKNTYIDALPQLVDPKTGKVHTSFNQTGTETGRLSSSNPNLQNIPIRTEIGAKIRSAIIASGKDKVLLSCDYSQVELRMLAHMSGDEVLIKAFKENKDIHRITASLIYGVSEKDVTDEMREVAKRVNFGIVYGQSSYGLSRDLGIPVEDAQGFIDNYFLRYPGVKNYIEDQIEQAERDGFVTTISGRRRYIPELKNKNINIRQFGQRQAVNTPLQGSSADLIKMAMINIRNEINKEKLKTKMILQIHDELLFDVPKGELSRVACLVKDKMENVVKLKVPVRVDIKKGDNWQDMEEVR
jgi:DNA polymerase-1